MTGWPRPWSRWARLGSDPTRNRCEVSHAKPTPVRSVSVELMGPCGGWQGRRGPDVQRADWAGLRRVGRSDFGAATGSRAERETSDNIRERRRSTVGSGERMTAQMAR
jgi:hypothetical protein